MSKNLLTIDWDFFIDNKMVEWTSILENNINKTTKWYKRYLSYQQKGKNLYDFFVLNPNYKHFFTLLSKHFNIRSSTPIYITDSHTYAYHIAKERHCDYVYSFDAHSDLGYGGLSSLDFELNCANWLGQLLKGQYIQAASIFYSPYTKENPDDFSELTASLPVCFKSLDQFTDSTIPVDSIHICLSETWSPPWYDEDFMLFLSSCPGKIKQQTCHPRDWSPANLTYSEILDIFLIS